MIINVSLLACLPACSCQTHASACPAMAAVRACGILMSQTCPRLFFSNQQPTRLFLCGSASAVRWNRFMLRPFLFAELCAGECWVLIANRLTRKTKCAQGLRVQISAVIARAVLRAAPTYSRFAESGPLLCVHIGYPDFLVIARSQRLCRWGMPQFSAHRNARLHSAVEPHAIADAYSAMFGRNAELRPAFPSYIHILARVWRTSLLLDDQPSRSVLGICCTRRYRSCA